MSEIQDLLQQRGGIKLDIGCGHNKHGPEWVGLDGQELEGVDIVHDFNVHPWPLPDECVIQAICSHVIEHIPPVVVTMEGTRFPFIEFMDEVWRILLPDGQFAISLPYGTSPGMLQDPTHCNFCNENTWLYFDPLENKAGGTLYPFYRPKPWKLETLFWDPTGNIEVLLTKRREDKSYHGEA